MREEFIKRAAAVYAGAHRGTPARPRPAEVGDLIIGECARTGASTVGVITAIAGPPRLGASALDAGRHYVVRCGDVLVTGEEIVRTLRPWVLVIAPVGSPVVCAACRGEHESAERFITCQIAHVRAERERVAVAVAA